MVTRIRAVLGVAAYSQNNVSGSMPDRIVTLSHPDSNRRPRNYTGSADLSAFTESARGLSTLWLIYRRWGISPRPENKRIHYNAND